MKKGGALPCALNAADGDCRMAAFLERRLPFLGIAEVIERVLARTPRAFGFEKNRRRTASRRRKRGARRKEEVERLSVKAVAVS